MKNEISRRDFLTRSSQIAGSAAFGFAVSAALPKSNVLRAAMPGQKIKVGQIGTAHPHARGKIETLRKLDEVFEVVGVVEPDDEQRKAALKQPAYQGLKWITEEQLLNTPGLKAVAIETTENELVPAGLRCVRAGMHIHIDKPPGESLSAFRELLDTADSRRLTVQAGYMFRYNPAFQFCFKAIREGWLGDVFEVHGVISKKISASSRESWLRYTGGTMFNLGSHLVDALVAVLGKPDKVTAYVRQTQPEVDNLKDNQLAVFEYPKATATIRSSVVEVEGGSRRQFVVCGDQGTVDIRPLERPRLRLALERDRGQYKKGYQDVELPKMPGRYDEQLIDFARIVRGEKAPDYTAEHDLIVHEALLRASGLPLEPKECKN
ncbi:MAG TPA: Gfo/Idh/MocA family oxidoreductase [Sedimentisphaerales bacterium]|nr:Gfo/Idh/MocA family oxidoreductase [Sedimentisphaerales bacterium]